MWEQLETFSGTVVDTGVLALLLVQIGRELMSTRRQIFLKSAKYNASYLYQQKSVSANKNITVWISHAF